jgi:putative oxidoreductase
MDGSMLKRLLQTEDDAGMLLARLALGLVIFPHGAQKMLGWFGGQGFAGTLQGLTTMGLPAVIALLVILIEFFGSIALILGFFGRIAAFGVLCVMVGAVFTVHLPNGFFMNWMGTQKGEGFEYHILAIGLALAVMVNGSGRGSFDRSMSDKGGLRMP